MKPRWFCNARLPKGSIGLGYLYRLLFLLVVVAGWSAPAGAIDIVLHFNDEDSLPYFDGGGVERTPDLQITFAVAEAFWEDIIEDDFTLTIYYWYSGVGSPQVSRTEVAGGRIFEADIQIPVGVPFYFDPNPITHDEFDMRIRLYRDTHPAEQGEAFSGAPPEVFEVGYNGYGPGPVDLLSVILHEMGHALGLAPALKSDRQCTADPYYSIDTGLVGGAVMGLKGYEGAGFFDCAHLALGGITECLGEPQCEAHQSFMWISALPSARQLPEAAGIFAIAENSNWTQLDLPRKYSLGSGLWGTASNWLGGRVPDEEYDDVYIINTPFTTVSLVGEDAFARNLTLTDANLLQITGPHKLDVLLDVNIDDGSTLSVNSFIAELEASHVNVGAAGELAVDLGLADIFGLINAGLVSGEGTVDVVGFENRGTVRGNGGVFNFTTTNPGGAYDLDGAFDDSDTLIDASNGNIDFVGDWDDSEFKGTIRVGPGRFLSFTDELTLSGPVEFDGGGSEALIDGPVRTGWPGEIDVDQTGRFGSTVRFGPNTVVHVNDADDELILSGQTDYFGGSYTGNGTIVQNSFALVQSNTTIDVAAFDWDGSSGVSTTTVFDDLTFTINSDTIEALGAVDGFDGTLNILGGTAAVNTTAPWALEGNAAMVGGDSPATLSGSDIDLHGTAAVQNDGLFESEINLYGTISTFDPGSVAILGSSSVNHILGGSITGDGTLNVASTTSLHGYGTIDVDLDIDGTVRAADGNLTVNGNFVDLGTTGTLDDTGTLDVTHDWNTLVDGLLDLRGGRVTGGDILNSATTAGHGVVGVSLFTNRGLLVPGGWEVVPGSDTGILRFEGSFQQVGAAVTEIGIKGLVPGDHHDQLIIRNNAGLGATLTIELLDGYVPECGDSFTIMTYGSVTGNFDTYNGLIINADLQLVPTVGATELVLTTTYTGDLDGDGDVDLGDLAALLANFGTTEGATYADGDLDGDGDVDLSDLAALLAKFNTSCP